MTRTAITRRRDRGLALAGATLSLLALAACSSSSSGSPSNAHKTADSTTAAGQPAGNSTAKSVDACTLVTAAELTQAAGADYTKIESANGGTLCNVSAASPTDAFAFHINKEDGSLYSWKSELATIKEDDGSATSVSGIGDRAIQGAVKEFAAEAHGYLVVVLNADVNNPATATDFTRTKKITKLLVSKL